MHPRHAIGRCLPAVLLVLVLFLPAGADAQSADGTDASAGSQLWAGDGGGIGTIGAGAFLSTSVGFLDVHLLTVRGLTSIERQRELLATKRPLENTWEVGVLYGRTLFDGDRATVTASAGEGFVGGMRRGKFWYTEELGTEPTKFIPRIRRSIDVYARDRFEVVSLPVEVRLHARPADLFGADFVLFGSLNRVDTYGGLAVQARLGPVR